MARLIEIDWPDYGRSTAPPPAGRDALRARLAALRTAMQRRGLDRLVVYGDREHFANIAWASGFDPRFEEALLIVAPDAAALLVGNEGLGYAPVSPLVAAGDLRVLHCPTLSLNNQPRDGARLADLVAAEVPPRTRTGLAGWKLFRAGEVPEGALDLPAFVVDALADVAGRGNLVPATDLFMHPGHGLRATVGPDEIAGFEFANMMLSRCVRDLVFALRPGMTDFEALAAARLPGLPLSCHPTFATGVTAALGLAGPTGQLLARGAPLGFNIGAWGANLCRAGWIAEGPADLPPAARDYVEAFAGPYLAALSNWFALMRPGTPGGAVQAAVERDLPFETYAVALNPGHLIHLDEWVSSPIFPGSDLPLRSGMALQVDIIPSHPVYGSTRMEEGIVIADEGLRAELARRCPALLARAGRRRAFMREVIGLDVPETVLPLADTAGIVPPFFLSPKRVLTLR